MDILQETICRVKDTGNGAGPLWCYGSTSIMRLGNTVVAAVPANDENVKPLADRHIEIYAKTGGDPWRMLWRDERFTREPAPLARRDDKSFWITLNPSAKDVPPGEGIWYGPAVPTLGLFLLDKGAPVLEKLPLGDFRFIDHSYRGLAVDRDTGDLFITWQHVEGEGKFRYFLCTKDKDITGPLEFPVRACYHNLAVRDGKAYALAVSDIKEPVAEWAAYKRSVTGREWDYDFRNLYFTCCDDISKGEFAPVMTVDSREETCGLIRNLDMYVSDDGICYILYQAKRVWHDFMRERFFPDTKFDTACYLCAVKDGEVLWRKVLDMEHEMPDGKNTDASYCAAFFQQADGSMGILLSKTNGNGTGLPDGWYISRPASEGNEGFRKLDISCPPGQFHTARPRCGAAPSDMVDVLTMDGEDIVYIRISMR